MYVWDAASHKQAAQLSPPCPRLSVVVCQQNFGTADTTVWILLGAFAAMFTAVLTLFMVQHLRIILYNRTQVEQTIRMEPPDSRWIFDVGRSANWRQFMGEHWWEWLLPIPPK